MKPLLNILKKIVLYILLAVVSVFILFFKFIPCLFYLIELMFINLVNILEKSSEAIKGLLQDKEE